MLSFVLCFAFLEYLLTPFPNDSPNFNHISIHSSVKLQLILLPFSLSPIEVPLNWYQPISWFTCHKRKHFVLVLNVCLLMFRYVCVLLSPFRSRTSQIIITSLRTNSHQTIAERVYGNSSSYDWWFYDRLDLKRRSARPKNKTIVE